MGRGGCRLEAIGRERTLAIACCAAGHPPRRERSIWQAQQRGESTSDAEDQPGVGQA